MHGSAARGNFRGQGVGLWGKGVNPEFLSRGGVGVREGARETRFFGRLRWPYKIRFSPGGDYFPASRGGKIPPLHLTPPVRMYALTPQGQGIG